jgi:hypothetical protein
MITSCASSSTWPLQCSKELVLSTSAPLDDSKCTCLASALFAALSAIDAWGTVFRSWVCHDPRFSSISHAQSINRNPILEKSRY